MELTDGCVWIAQFNMGYDGIRLIGVYSTAEFAKQACQEYAEIYDPSEQIEQWAEDIDGDFSAAFGYDSFEAQKWMVNT